MKELNPDERQKIVNNLKARFQQNLSGQKDLLRVDVETRLNIAGKSYGH